jgi:segregation and condensation protein B
MTDSEVFLPVIESLILASPEPLAARKISEVVDNISPGEVDLVVEELNRKYRENDISFRIRKIAGGYQVYITEDYARYVEDLLTRRRNVRLTRAAMETLAITAYRQPVTKSDIEMIRGVASDSVIHTLLERKLITLAGRAETVGRPLLYKTTDEFLKFFNLASLNDLPRMEEIEELLAAGEAAPQQSLPLNGDQTAPSTTEHNQSDDESVDDEESSQPNAHPLPTMTTEALGGFTDGSDPDREKSKKLYDFGETENAEENEKDLQQVETSEDY